MPSGEIRPAEPGLRVPQATQDMQWCSLTIPMPKVQVRCCPPREAPRGGLPYPALILCNDFNVRSLLAYNISLLIYNVNSYLIDYQCFS